MENKEYEIMYNIEDNYWWYVGLRELVFSFINKFSRNHNSLRILDAGCGTGGVLQRYAAYKAYGFDMAEQAIQFCKSRHLNNIIIASVCDIPFKDNSFNFIVSLDVLYHKSVKSDIDALREFYRVLGRDGRLIMNLPAYNFLQSTHDKAIHTQHRYTRTELIQKIKKVGFSIEKITYRNAIFFPFIAIERSIKKITTKKDNKAESDLKPLPNFVNKLLSQILFLENKLISVTNLPFGLSVFCVARKK